MSWRDPDFKYHNAAETAKPGYLKRRFAQIIRAQKEADQRCRIEVAEKVRPMDARRKA